MTKIPAHWQITEEEQKPCSYLLNQGDPLRRLIIERLS